MQAMARIVGTAAESTVSYADMIALAGAHAVSLTGGPKVSVPIGGQTCFTDDH
jgi:L-ascorbate peroxidase